MKLTEILIKPILSEKANAHAGKTQDFILSVLHARQTNWRSKKRLKISMV